MTENKVKSAAKRFEKELRKKLGKNIYVAYSIDVSRSFTLRVQCDDENVHCQIPTEYDGFPVETDIVPRAGG